MYGGTIEGEYVSLEQNKHIEMKWRFRDWEEYSDVSIIFEDNGDVSCKHSRGGLGYCLITFNG